MIKVGVAGNVVSGSAESFVKVRELGLAQEVEFVRGVYMKKDEAKKLGGEFKDVKLSIHAPYYINLASKEKVKIGQSRSRILKCCEIGHYLGASNIVFHAGYYQGRGAEEVYIIIKEQILKILAEVKKKKWKVKLCVETTGKESQFGSLDEILRLIKDTGCSICVDFAHLKARSIGKIDYGRALDKIKKEIKGEIHAHYSGIEYGPKGERRHLMTDMKEFKVLAKEILKRKMKFVIINESPDPLNDALKMKGVLEGLKPS